MGDFTGGYYRSYSGDTTSLDYGSYEVVVLYSVWVRVLRVPEDSGECMYLLSMHGGRVPTSFYFYLYIYKYGV